MLELLCKSGHGAPPISNEDVPEGLHKPEGMAPSEIDTAYFARWEYVLNEMRWSFDQLRVRDLPEETTRIDNGLRLFGKYYRDLWT